MRSLILVMVTSVMVLSILSGCNPGNHDPERYVLTGSDKNVFFHEKLAVNPTKVDAIADAVKSFSWKHSMDFLMAKESLPPGDFNISANGPTLNIKAMHSAAIGDIGVEIFAIVPKGPTAADRALVKEFVVAIEAIK